MKNSFCTFFFSILSVFALNHVTMAFKGTDLDLVAKLSVLKPLPKVHYFWPLAHENLTDESRLYELARITHTMCIGTWYTQEEVDRCVSVCARVNKTNPVIKASLGVEMTKTQVSSTIGIIPLWLKMK